MKSVSFIKKFLLCLCALYLIPLAQAATPVWTFTALTSTTLTVPANETATVSYRVTNQSSIGHLLVMKSIPGIYQVAVPNSCGYLGPHQSCILQLLINGNALTADVLKGPVLCEHGNTNLCYQPSAADSLHIRRGPAATFKIGGSVSGLLGTVVLTNNGVDALTLNADGSFTFSIALPPGSIYSVAVQTQPVGQTCTVNNGTGVVTNADITNVTVICSTNTFTVGGMLSGLDTAGSETVVLQNNGTDNLLLNANGSFTFSTPIAQGATYNVTVLTQPATQTCTVTNGSGTMGGSNVTNVIVQCATNAFTVGGTVTGLAASESLVLQNNGADNLLQSTNGSFTFSTPVAQGAAYSVTILTQPSTQTCTVSNGSGTIGGANVTNVNVNCVDNTTLSSSIASGSTLALSVTGRTEYGITGTPSSGVPRIITITNSGAFNAVGFTVSYTGLPPGTTHTGSCDGLTTLAQGSSCTIQINPSTSPSSNNSGSYVACSNGTSPNSSIAQVSATNANTLQTNFVVLDYGCIYQGGLVFAFDDTQGCPSICSGNVGGKAVTASNLANAIWSSNGVAAGTTFQRTSADVIPGIDELSTSTLGSPSYSDFTTFFASFYTNTNPFTPSSFAMCNGITDGFCNTANILLFYNQFITNNTNFSGGTAPFTASAGPTTTNYPALLCDQSAAGGFNDWYLPAICEMGYEVSDPSGCGTSSAPLLQNIQLSLRNLVGLTTPAGNFWSSTEQQGQPQFQAWSQVFLATTGNQLAASKAGSFATRCVRVF